MIVNDIVKTLNAHDISCYIIGDGTAEISTFSSIYNYKPGSITWIRDASKLTDGSYTKEHRIACLIADKEIVEETDVVSQIIVDDARKAFFDIVGFYWTKAETPKVSTQCFIEDTVQIGRSPSIGAYTIIEGSVVIGNNCRIGNNVSIKGRVTIGDDVTIQSGAVIGEDGFAFIHETEKLTFVQHYGGITIGNNVSIGSNTCICRGTIDDTVICDYVKIDNLCHIAHNVHIGQRTEVIAGAVIMGSVHIGDDCWIATSMIRDQRVVGNHCTVGMGAIVVKDIPDGITVVGNPAKPFIKEQ